MADVVPGGEAAVKAGVKSAKSVPPVVWIIAVVGGLAVSYYLSRKGSGGGGGGEENTPFAVTYTGVGGGANTGSGTTAPVSSAPKSNEEWGFLAKQYLIARGSGGAGGGAAVDLAINKYLAGAPLSAQETAMVGIAIQGIGPTPQALPPTGGDVKVPGTPPANPQPIPGMAGNKWFTVTSEKYLSEVVKKGYGLGPDDVVNVQYDSIIVRSGNPQIDWDAPNAIHSGLEIFLPPIPL